MYAVELLPQYDCATCTAHQKKERGCEEPIKGQINVLVIDGEEHRRCPRRPILEQPGYYAHIFWLFRQRNSGYLIEPGGLNDQPGKLMQCFKVIDRTLIKIQDEKERQEQAKRRRAAISGGRHRGTPVKRRGRR